MVSPAFHRRCSTCGRRERTLWHLNIWQYETIVHGAVLRAPRTACMPQGYPERSVQRRITALFEAQLIRDGALRYERCGHKPLHETAPVHMEAAWEGDIEGEGRSRLFQSRVCRHRRHRQKVRSKLYQHHGRPGPPARHQGRRRTRERCEGSEMSLRSTQGPDEGLRGHTRHGKDITPWKSPQRCPRPPRSWTASM